MNWPRFGPFAQIPPLASVKPGSLNAWAMPRGSGATTLAKIFLRIVDAPARVKIDGEHVEQYEQDLSFHFLFRLGRLMRSLSE